MSNQSRDEFPDRIKRIVGERAAYICTNPVCRVPTIGPHSDPNKSLKTGEACHIRAAASGGPRYCSDQTEEERSSIENAIWLCNVCGTRIDKDAQRFPVQLLLDWKGEHDTWLMNGGIVPSLPGLALQTLNGLTIPDVPSRITADQIRTFRQHKFRIVNASDV